MGLVERDYIRERASSGYVEQPQPKLIVVACASAVLMAAYAWLERPDLFAAIGLPNAAPALVFPASGTAAYLDGRPPSIAVGFIVRDMSGENLEKVVRFRTPDSRTFIAELYLRPGGSGEIRLPPGTYRIHLMQGHVWRGPDVHFGAGAETFDMGVTEIGHRIVGMDIRPRSMTSDAVPITGMRF